jgi:hypothetical protein
VANPSARLDGAFAVEGIGPPVLGQTSLVVWCAQWWWVIVLSGLLLAWMLRSIGWLVQRMGIT